MKLDWFTKSALAVIAVSLFVLAFGRPLRPSPAVAADPPAGVALNLQDVEISAVPGTPYPQFLAFNRHTGNFAFYRVSLAPIPGSPNSSKPYWDQSSPMGHIDSVGAKPTTTEQQ